MDFSWSASQLTLKQRVVEFAQQQLAESSADRIERDHRGTFSKECWLLCAEFGIL